MPLVKAGIHIDASWSSYRGPLSGIGARGFHNKLGSMAEIAALIEEGSMINFLSSLLFFYTIILGQRNSYNPY